jgi:hypothetical protein
LKIDGLVPTVGDKARNFVFVTFQYERQNCRLAKKPHENAPSTAGKDSLQGKII